MAVKERTKNRLKVNDPNNKEAFLSWLRARVKHYGYEENNAPDYYSKALKSANPHDLPNSLWTEWYEFNNPNDIQGSFIKGNNRKPREPSKLKKGYN